MLNIENPKQVRQRRLNNLFTYHPPKPGQKEKYEEIRKKGKELASLLMEVVPESREQALALTKVEEAVMWANAGIARNGEIE